MNDSASLQPTGYLPYPYSLTPLPLSLRRGLYAIATLALISLIATITLLGFLTYRMFIVHWLRPRLPAANSVYKHQRNQSMVLVYNLLLADLIQALAFVINFHWARIDAILAPSNTCSAQGWFVSMGDSSSGLFSLLIGIQTFSAILFRWQPSTRVFNSVIIATWLFGLSMSTGGPLAHIGDSHYFVRANGWCWVSSEFGSERLWLHYLWIFICEFGSLALYTVLFINLRRKTTTTPIAKLANSMLVYPMAYTLLTLPLAAGRMATSAGNPPSLDFFVVAGALMTSCGWVDVILFTCTRRMIVLEAPLAKEPGEDDNDIMGGGPILRYGNVTTILGMKTLSGSEDEWESGRGGSSENIVRMEQVISVTVEDVDGHSDRRLNDGQHPWVGQRSFEGGIQ